MYHYFESSSDIEQHQATKISWNAPYFGTYDRELADAIVRMKAQANGAPYKNILPIIQSSGTGKSRLAHEVAKFIVTIPMNVRSPEDKTAYPAPDHYARNFIVGHRSTSEAASKVVALLVSLFCAAAELIRAMSPGTMYSDEEELAAAWRQHLDSNDGAMRGELYARATRMAQETISSLEAQVVEDNPRLGGYFEHSTRFYYVHQRLSKTATEDGPQHLVAAIKSRLSNEMKHPDVAVLVYVDEVYDIATIATESPSNQYLSDQPPKSLYECLLDAFTTLGPSEPIFMLTMTTNPAVVPRRVPLQHLPPYSPYIWDIPLEDDHRFTTLTLADVADPQFMVRLGRPLFSTRHQAAVKAHLGFVTRVTRDFAAVKLILCSPPTAFIRGDNMPYSHARFVAPLCMRLSPEFDLSNPTARELTEEMVAKHMRIICKMPAHNDYVETATPSEPLMAEAAAWVMAETKRVDWLDTLTRLVKSEIVRKERCGALAARMLLNSAFDRAVAATGSPWKRISYSIAVPVCDFLRSLFAEAWHATVLGCVPAGGGMPLGDAFAGAFVRFSHYDELYDGEPLDARAAFKAVVRGHAIRILGTHDSVQIALPVVMRDAPLAVDLMSYIFIQLKGRHGAACPPDAEDLADVFRGLPHAHPVIHIAMQLEAGAPPKPVSRDGGGSDAPAMYPCYQLAALGCSAAVYSVINPPNAADYTTLATPNTLLSNHARQDPASLAAVQRLKPEWERGPACYDWVADPALHSPKEEGPRVEGVFAV